MEQLQAQSFAAHLCAGASTARLSKKELASAFSPKCLWGTISNPQLTTSTKYAASNKQIVGGNSRKNHSSNSIHTVQGT